MKHLTSSALAAGILVATGVVAAAQPAVVPLRVTPYGQPVCPSNYVVRGNACVSIYVTGGAIPGVDYGGSYNYRPRGGGHYGRVVQPRWTPYGPQCPSNYDIRGGVCVYLY